MAVLPLYRKRGIATELVTQFAKATAGAMRLGCATPNPIAALIVSRVIPGLLYFGRCNPPVHLRNLLQEIHQQCFDLRGCFIDEENFTIKTGFSPLSRSDEREWTPRTPQSPPPWWAWVEHLPNEFEALLLIERADH